MEQAEPLLVRRALRGDRGAFSDLVAGHWTPLVRLARSVVGDADAEDAVQDALVAAWRRLSSLRRPSAFSPWLSRVVVRVCFKRVRQRRPWLPLDDAPEPLAVTDPGGAVDVERLLAALAPRQRAVMHLTVVEGMSDSEIAAVLDISAAGVRAHRRRARESLGHLLNGARS
ncbi:MAG TPA: RNA polymerase sigma factor [Thermoanaerobaculia bacterium]|jgi:RNA polymerase sigma-70 factor (ECF subfamily)